jgi:NAD(P)-dependent dehydrogenase (short-subunit alcohol dehydrogenase family)
MDMRLKDQIAIVTGAGQGLGQQIALRLAVEGVAVVIADINETGSRETADMILKLGGREALLVPTDITSEKQVAHLIKATLGLKNRIDILVNNSGIMGPVKSIEDISVEEWDATMAVNLRGTFLCCKHVIPQMKIQEKGSIVNISSVTGKRPLIQRSPYAASKMGVIGLTRTLAAEVGKWKIRVNAICPAAVKGKRVDLAYEGVMKATGKTREQVIAERIGTTPLQDFTDPKYIAGLVVFLCTEDAAMMTGQDINVSGGAVMY